MKEEEYFAKLFNGEYVLDDLDYKELEKDEDEIFEDDGIELDDWFFILFIEIFWIFKWHQWHGKHQSNFLKKQIRRKDNWISSPKHFKKLCILWNTKSENKLNPSLFYPSVGEIGAISPLILASRELFNPWISQKKFNTITIQFNMPPNASKILKITQSTLLPTKISAWPLI